MTAEGRQSSRRDGEEDLLGLPLPLPSLGVDISAVPEDLADAAKEALDTEMTWGLGGTGTFHRSDFAMARVGSIVIASGRTTPVALRYKQSAGMMVEMCYAGRSRFRDGSIEINSTPGGIIAFPNKDGVICGHLHSGISFFLEQQALERTLRSVLGGQLLAGMEAPLLIGGNRGRSAGSGSCLLFSLFQHIDRVLSEDRYIPASLSLDDQIYRTLVTDWARRHHAESLASRWSEKRRWNAVLDDLVDYIRLGATGHLTMTDLEEKSHYSARHLQHLFKDRFDCTPMQFVRRQRLSTAMERLQAARPDDTVTGIARQCGYRFASNFSTDFQKEFGVKPSTVLRASRGRLGGGGVVCDNRLIGIQALPAEPAARARARKPSASAKRPASCRHVAPCPPTDPSRSACPF